MRSRVTAVAVGLALIGVGVVFSGNTLGWWDVDVFFTGWWTLFLIVPALVSIVASGPNVANVLLLVLGVTLYLDQARLLGDASAWSIFVPVALLVLGVAVLLKALRGPRLPRDAEGRTVRPGEDLTAVFGGAEAVYTNLPFKGVTTTALFGGVDLDLRGAVITEDVVIDATSIFGGTDVIVSPGTKVNLTSVGIFGGSENHAGAAPPDAPGPVVHIRSTAIFGGLEVKVQ
jgi:predicted membrane protein